MAEATRPARCFAKRRDLVKGGPQKRLKHELRDAFAVAYRIRLRPGIEQIYHDFPPVIRINEPDALGHGDAPHSAEPASGIDESRYSRVLWLNSDSGGDGSSFSRGNDDHIFVRQAGAQVGAGGFARGGAKAVLSVNGCGIAKKKDMYGCLGARYTCHNRPPVGQS